MYVRVHKTIIYLSLPKNRSNHVGVPKIEFCTPFFVKIGFETILTTNNVFKVVTRFMCTVIMVNRCEIVFKSIPFGFHETEVRGRPKMLYFLTKNSKKYHKIKKNQSKFGFFWGVLAHPTHCNHGKSM